MANIERIRRWFTCAGSNVTTIKLYDFSPLYANYNANYRQGDVMQQPVQCKLLRTKHNSILAAGERGVGDTVTSVLHLAHL